MTPDWTLVIIGTVLLGIAAWGFFRSPKADE